MVLLSSIIACETDCVPKETIIENKLTPEILSYFPYDSLDTIHCIIDSQQNLVIQSFEKVDGIQKSADYDRAKCGTNVFYENHYRIVRYYDQNGSIILVAKLQLRSKTSMVLDFDFYNIPIRENYGIIISTSSGDTATIAGHFYDDVFTTYSSTRDYTLNYSKSVGLVRITAGGKSLFQLVR